MSTLRVDNIKSRTGTAVTIPSGQSLDVTGDVNVTGGLEISGSSNFNTSGIITAGTFSGSGSGLTGIAATNNIITGTAVTITNATDSTSTTTGALQVTGGVGIGLSLTVGGSVSVGGTLTYEDVTNVDSVGLITARSGVEFGAAGVGGTITALGHAEFAGIVTASSFSGAASQITVADESSDTTCNVVFTTAATGDLAPKTGTNLTFDSADGKLTATQFIGVATGGTASGATVGVGTTSTILGVTDGATQNRFGGVLVEKASIQAAKLADTTIDLAQGNVHYFTTNGTGATTAAIKYKGGNNVSTFMNIGDNISISVISLPNNAEYINAVTIDGGAVTEEWLGGSIPSSASGGAGTVTVTNINITKILNSGTDANDFLVLCSVNSYGN